MYYRTIDTMYVIFKTTFKYIIILFKIYQLLFNIFEILKLYNINYLVHLPRFDLSDFHFESINFSILNFSQLLSFNNLV